jgi:SAM-dependent methyltransferase
MDEGWEHPSDGFSIPQEEEKSINTLMSSNETGRLPSTYGEITQLGARQLFSYMKLRSDISTLQSSNKKMESINDETKISFVDLGCGTGRLLVQAYLELPTVCNFLGIELSKARYSMAAYAWKELQDNATVVRHEGDAVNATLQFLHGDLFDLDVSAATHIYVASLCFTDNMMIRLGDKLIQEGKSLQCIATLKPFPLQCNNALGGEPIRQYVEMTWTKSRGQGCTVYFYYL